MPLFTSGGLGFDLKNLVLFTSLDIIIIIIMAIELVQAICRRTAVITQDTRETVFLFQRLSIALQRGNAVSFLNTMNTEREVIAAVV